MRFVRRTAAVFLLYAALAAAGMPAHAQNVTDTIQIPDSTFPDGIAVNPVTNAVYVIENLNSICIVDGNNDTTLSVPGGEEPVAVAVNPVTNKAYVVNNGSSNVTVIEGFGYTRELIDVGYSPGPIAVNSITNKIYVGCSNGITIIDGATNTTTSVTVPDSPSAIAVNPVTNKIYAPCPNSNKIAVIDGTIGTLTATIAGPSDNRSSVAVNPVTNKIYVTDTGSGKVLIIDGATNKLFTSITTSSPPTEIAVNPATNKIYTITGTTLTAINGANLAQTTIPVGTNPQSISINPNANTITVANAGSNTATVIDGATNSAVSLAVGSTPIAVATNPITNKTYVANADSSTVSVIDGAPNTGSSVPAGTQPAKVIVNPQSNKIYAINSQSNNVTVINGNGGATKKIAVGGVPRYGAVNVFTNMIYVVNENDNTVSVINGSTDAVVATVNTGEFPDYIAVNVLTNKIYVANQTGNTVTVIDGATNATSTIAVGAAPSGIAINQLTNKIYVANNGDDDVSVIDGFSNTVINTVTAGSQPGPIAVNTTTNKIYIGNMGTNTVTVIDGSNNSTTNVTVGSTPRAIAINSLTNRAYVANQDGTVTIINTANGTKSLNAGAYPISVAVDQVRNKIFISNYLGNTITAIDGISNAILTIGVGSNPSDVAVNPITGKVYVANQYGNNVIAITTQPSQPAALTTAITPLPGNSTTSAIPVFTFTPTSAFTPTAPKPQHVYYQVDDLDGRWTAASGTSPTFTGPAVDGSHPLSEGLHTLYAYAEDGQMATSTQKASAFTGAITSYVFRVGPSAGTHIVLSAPSTAIAGSKINVTVTIVDDQGKTINPYPGTIHFTSDDPTAFVPTDVALTNGTGIFPFILKAATKVTIRARDVSSPSATGTTTVTVTPDVMSQLTITAPTKVVAGIAFTATVSAQDKYHNIVKSFADTIHLSSSDTYAVLPADTKLPGGTKQFSIKLITPGLQKITVIDTQNSAFTASLNTSVDVEAAKLVISAPTTTTAGSMTTFTVTAVDTVHNTATRYNGIVHITSSDGTAVLPANAKLTNGIGSFKITFKKAGSQSITATDTVNASITGIASGIVVKAAAASKFVISVPASVTSGAAFAVTVTAQDAYGNTALGYTGTVHYTSSDALAVVPANMTLTNGSAKVTVKLKTKGNQTVSAADTANATIKGTSPAIAVN